MVWAAPIGLRFKRQGYEFDSGPSGGLPDDGGCGCSRCYAIVPQEVTTILLAIIEHALLHHLTRLLQQCICPIITYSYETVSMGSEPNGLFVLLMWDQFFSWPEVSKLSQSHPLDAGNQLPCQFFQVCCLAVPRPVLRIQFDICWMSWARMSFRGAGARTEGGGYQWERCYMHRNLNVAKGGVWSRRFYEVACRFYVFCRICWQLFFVSTCLMRVFEWALFHPAWC